MKAKWDSEKNSEVEFWKVWIETKGADWPEDYKRRTDPNAPFQPNLIEYLPEGNDLSILDVGAGPLTKLGKIAPSHSLTITAVDALADDYNKLLEEHGVTPLVKTQSCEVEKLADMFSSNSFDMVFMCNALDHSYDAIEGIKQMLGVVKSGCYVALDHATNEAETANYGGFHQWNLCEEDGDFIIWNKETRVNVTEMLRNIADVSIKSDASWNFVRIRKH